MLKRVVDVELVLQWAFRDELPKRRDEREGGGEAASVSPMFRACAFGSRIDNWSREPGFPVAMGEAHPDALRVLDAVEGVKPEDLDLRTWAAWSLGNPLGLDVEAMAEDAARQVVGLVVSNAKAGTRPYEGDELAVKQKRGANGQPEVYGKVKGALEVNGETYEVERDAVLPSKGREGGSYPPGSYCKILYAPGLVRTYSARAEYAAWHAALVVLADRLADRLESRRVTAPTAPAKPWDGERDRNKSGRILPANPLTTARPAVRSKGLRRIA